MDKDEYQKFLDKHINFKAHKKYESAESEGFIELTSIAEKCKDCDLTVDRAPIRTHRIVKGGYWLSYCKDCQNYRDPDTGRYDLDRNGNYVYQKVYKKLGNVVDEKPTNDSNQSDDS